MQVSEHLHLVLPEQGTKALVHITDKLDPNGKPIVQHRWFNDTDGLVAAVGKLNALPRIYMGMAGYDDAKKRKQEHSLFIRSIYHDLDAGPEKYAKAVAKGKPDSVYETQQHAIADVARLAKLTGMVPTLINSSGMGLHVYWVLDRDYSVAEALPVMLRVKAAFKALGVKSDPAVPGDTARILRPVGSLHSVAEDGTEIRVTNLLHKPAKVYTLDQVNDLIDPHVPVSIFLPKSKVYEDFTIVNNDILQYREHTNSLAKGAEKCAALAEIRDLKGAVEEPYWRLMIGVSTFCQTDGEYKRHEWSEGDSRYDEGQVEDYANRWNAGPPKCATFAEHCDKCHSCPYAGKITSPIQLCRVDAVVEAVTELPEAPLSIPEEQPDASFTDFAGETDAPVTAEEFNLAQLKASRPELFERSDKVNTFYFKDTGSGGEWRLYARILEEVTGADGTTTKVVVDKHVASRLFWYESCTMSTSEDSGGTQVELVVVMNPSSLRRQRCHIPASVMADNSGFAKAMLSNNIIFTHERNAISLTRTYMTMEQNRVQNETRYAVRKRFGYDWFTHKGADTFVCAYGDLLQFPNGRIERVMMNPALDGAKQHILPGALPASDKGVWAGSVYGEAIVPAAQKYAEFIRKHYAGPEYAMHRMVIALGIGSAYLVFTDPSSLVPGGTLPPNGGVVSLYSTETGKGKTALLNVIGAAFGAGAQVLGGDKSGATQLGRSTLASQLGVFPLLLDEVSQNDADRQASEIQNFANGQSRVRATKTGGLSKPDNWNLITLMSTNKSQVDLVRFAPDKKNVEAILARLIEIDFSCAPDVDQSTSSFGRDYAEISRLGGAVGMLLTRIAVSRGRNDMAEKCQKRFAEVCGRYDMNMNTRFYGRMFSAAFMANRALAVLGVNLFDEDDLADSFGKVIRNLVNLIKVGRKTASSHVDDLIDDMSRHIAVTHSYPTRGFGTTVIKHTPVLNESYLVQPMVGREVKESGVLMIRVKDVQKWCAEKKIPLEKMLAALIESGRLIYNTKANSHQHKRSLTAGIAGVISQPRCQVFMFNIADRGGLSVVGEQRGAVFEDEPEAVSA